MKIQELMNLVPEIAVEGKQVAPNLERDFLGLLMALLGEIKNGEGSNITPEEMQNLLEEFPIKKEKSSQEEEEEKGLEYWTELIINLLLNGNNQKALIKNEDTSSTNNENRKQAQIDHQTNWSKEKVISYQSLENPSEVKELSQINPKIEQTLNITKKSIQKNTTNTLEEISPSDAEGIRVSELPSYVRDLALRLHPKGRHEARIRLHPPELGEMQLSVSVDKGEVKLLFTVEHPRTAEMLQQHLPQLENSFQELGLQFGGADINLAQNGSGSLPGEGSNERKLTIIPQTQKKQTSEENAIKYKRSKIDILV